MSTSAVDSKVTFLVQRESTRVRATERGGDLVAEAPTLAELRAVVRAAVERRYGGDRRISLLVGERTAPAAPSLVARLGEGEGEGERREGGERQGGDHAGEREAGGGARARGQDDERAGGEREAAEEEPLRAGDVFLLMAEPPPQYAGRAGARARVVSVSVSDGVYVLFDGGIREYFPHARFAELFAPLLGHRRAPRPALRTGASAEDARARSRPVVAGAGASPLPERAASGALVLLPAAMGARAARG